MPYDEATIRKILGSINRIAIIGAKDAAGQPVDRVGRYLIEAGYTLLPVHPVRTSTWGIPNFKSITELPAGKNAPELVVLFRAPEFCLEHANECLSLSPLPGVFWMQLGISNKEARAVMENAGIVVVENACIMVEHKHLLPSA